MNALITKDIVFAMFSLGLSIFIGRELFRSVVQFFIELAYGIQVFSQESDPSLADDGQGKITKDDIRRINESDERRQAAMQRIQKSITCKTARSRSRSYSSAFVHSPSTRPRSKPSMISMSPGSWCCRWSSSMAAPMDGTASNPKLNGSTAASTATADTNC